MKRKIVLFFILTVLFLFFIWISCSPTFNDNSAYKRKIDYGNTGLNSDGLDKADNVIGTNYVGIQGFAAVNANSQYSTTGGEGGLIVTATSASQLIDYISRIEPLIILVKGTISLPSGMHLVASNKSILGYNYQSSSTSAATYCEITGGGLLVGLPYDTSTASPPSNAVKNVIIKNIKFSGPAANLIEIQMFSNHIWIDHCEFLNSSGGFVNVTSGSDYVTISWNKFINQNMPCNIGYATDSPAQNNGRLKVTCNFNSFNGTGGNNSFIYVRNAEPVHIFSNYFNNSSYGVISASDSGVKIEDCYFNIITYPGKTTYTSETGKITESNNTLVSCANTIETGGAVQSIDSYYSYIKDTAAAVNSRVKGSTGPRTFIVSSLVTPDSYEDDSSLSQANSLALSSGQNHTLDIPYDADYYSFQATSGNTYIISASSSGAYQVDTDISVFGPGINGARITGDYTRISSGRVLWTCSSSGVYYIKIFAHENATFADGRGNYTAAVYLLSNIAQDGYEPNDTMSDAKIIDLNIYNLTIHTPTDIDYIKVEALNGYTYIISTSSYTNNLDTELTVYDANGQQVAYNNDYNGRLQASLTFTCTISGVYYVKVNSYNNIACGDYNFSFGNTAIDPSVPDTYESDDTASAAKLDVFNLYQDQLRTLHTVSDVDYIKFNAVYKNGYYVILTADQSAMEFGLYKSDGITQICNFQVSQNSSKTMSWPCMEAGTYFLRISGYQAVVPSNYKLKLYYSENELVDENVNNNSIESATDLITGYQEGINQVYYFAIGNPADVDYCKFWAVNGNTYQISVNGNYTASEYWHDVDYSFIDKNGSTVLFTDNNEGNPAPFDFSCTSSGYYYFYIHGHDIFSRTSYEILTPVTGVPDNIDAYEVDDRYSMAQIYYVGLGYDPYPLYAHSIHILGDIDVYRIAVDSQCPLFLTVTAPDFDVELKIYNEETGILLTTINDINKTSAVFTHPVSGQQTNYILAINAVNNSSTGNYTVKLSVD